MRYPNELYRKAETELNIRRLTALNELDQHKWLIRQSHPEIDGMRRLINSLGVRLGRAMVANDNKTSEKILIDIQETRSAIYDALIAAGLPGDYLEAPFMCKLCEDKGLFDGRYCECRQQILNRLVYEKLADVSPAEECSFDNFDLSYYTDNRKSMAALLKACRRYAEEFTSASPNLLFMGPTGLGKTHLSLSIAREVVNRGKSVMYASAVRLVERITDSAMGVESEDEYCHLVFGCDLLVVDDLGAELKTHVTKSKVYDLIDSRRRERRPTIINTNLSLKEIEKTYEPRVLSRLGGDYVTYQFSGEDIRFQKKRRKMNVKAEKCAGAAV